MNVFVQGSDATRIYRETSNADVLRLDRTADAGSLLDYMRNASINLGSPARRFADFEERIPETPSGSVDAYFSR